MIGLELGISVASAALRREPTGAPTGFRSDVAATAKRDLKKGEVLDGEGGFCVWGKQTPADAVARRGLFSAGPRAERQAQARHRRGRAAEMVGRRVRPERSRRARPPRDGGCVRPAERANLGRPDSSAGARPCSTAPRPRMRDRLAMHNANALKIGLFGANCSSGRSATRVPERWSASWADCLALARMADAAGIDFLLPIGRWKGYGGDTDLHGEIARDHHLGHRPARRDRAHHRVRHRARAAVSSDHRRQADASPPTTSARAASGSTSSPAGTRASSRCSACSSASTRRATPTRRSGSRPSRWPGARRRISTSTASTSS